ncbi:uncharacterized protein LOC126293201 [Schistocerca gregaria]|uniref:uncharacterized protein LOC126293201 n=1 Tax=Schistocerca gregaria TaxID=7010 RepID=UPI00211E5D58|nr:uncharacterized protein LOC126293201 [Schistocerca gregaria]
MSTSLFLQSKLEMTESNTMAARTMAWRVQVEPLVKEHRMEKTMKCRWHMPRRRSQYVVTRAIPVRSVTATTGPVEVGDHHAIPHTKYSSLINARFADQSATTLLMSSIRGVSVRDKASVMSIAKAPTYITETPQEVMAMLRILCMAASWDQSVHRVDPTMLKLIRGIQTVTPTGPTYYGRPGMGYPDGVVSTIPLDLAVALGLNKLADNQLDDVFSYGTMDVTWTMVPITQTTLMNPSAFIYMMGFLDSGYWNGLINNHYDVDWTEGDTVRKGNITTLPNINSVRLPGPTSILLVLIDCIAKRLFGIAYVVYGNRQRSKIEWRTAASHPPASNANV